MIHPSEIPSLVYADSAGNIIDFDEISMAGMAAGTYRLPEISELIELPPGSELFALPQRQPVGFDPHTHEPVLLANDPHRSTKKVQAVAAFMAPAHTAILSAAYQSTPDCVRLPLYAYTAVGWHDERFWVAAFRSDPDQRQEPHHFKQRAIDTATFARLEAYRDNRLVQHLGTCCLSYQCPAARNFFLARYEAPLPCSPHCNARCLGCISKQPSQSCPATQERINFVPTADELAEVALLHIDTVKNPVVSFGQGCEGEPLLQARLMEKAIGEIRRHTERGTINLNSNASLPDAVARLARAGLDSIRVSLNSAQPRYYERYYRPANYSLDDVMESIAIMKQAGRFVSLNYFIMPGFTDSHDETTALFNLLEKTGVDLIQLRNLNIDPEFYLNELRVPADLDGHGMSGWLRLLNKTFPAVRTGYFNPCLNPDI